MGLIDDVGKGPVALDTSAFIYFIEEHPDFLAIVEPVFVAVDQGKLLAVTSSVTLLETLVLPLRKGDSVLAQKYEALLTDGKGLTMIDLDRPLLRSAAGLRASFGLKTPDALQIAAAIAGSASVFVTNDAKLTTIASVQVLRLRDYLPRR